VKLKKPKHFCGVLTSSRLHPAILSLKGLYCCHIYFHFSYMYSYYNYSQSMCIKLQNFNVSYPDLMQFITLWIPFIWHWKRGLGLKGGLKTGCLYGYLYGLMFSNFFVCFIKIMFWANMLCMYGNRIRKTLNLGFSFHPFTETPNWLISKC